jgi:hypothetical protein
MRVSFKALSILSLAIFSQNAFAAQDCWKRAKIKTLRVKVEGAVLPNANRGDSRSPLKNAGNSKKYTFSFGQNMSHVVADESKTPIFKAGGEFITKAFAGREIQELRELKISKAGVAYQNNSFKLNGLMGIGTWSGYHRFETDLRQLSKISIFVNDQLVFERGDISYTFAASSLSWPSTGGEPIQSNPAFIKLMSRKDCPAP